MDHQWIIKLKVLFWNGTKDHSTNDQKLTITVKNRRIFIGIFQIRISTFSTFLIWYILIIISSKNFSLDFKWNEKVTNMTPTFPREENL